jgi:hypothetical protein
LHEVGDETNAGRGRPKQMPGRKQHSPVMAERSGGNRHATREVRLPVR